MLVLPSLSYAQHSRFPQRLELVESDEYEVFNMPLDSLNRYWLSVGRPGMGNETVQFYVDPMTELFIPLGATLSEAVATLEYMKQFAKEPRGTSYKTEGSLAVGFPKDELLPVAVTARRMLFTRQLEFTVEREGYLRSAYIDRSNLSSLLSGLKLYRKLHPKEDRQDAR